MCWVQGPRLRLPQILATSPPSPPPPQQIRGGRTGGARLNQCKRGPSPTEMRHNGEENEEGLR